MAKYEVLRINSDDTIQSIEFDDYNIDLLFLQQIGSTIQIVRSGFFRDILICCDDNGKVLHKPFNRLATFLYGQYPADFIVGDIFVGSSFVPDHNDLEPDMYALTSSRSAELKKILSHF